MSRKARHSSANRPAPRASAATPGTAANARWPGRLLAPAVLAAVCLVAYWNSFRAGLILDNTPIILNDPRLRVAAWQNVIDVFTHDYWWPTGESGLFRPLTTLSFWVNHAVFSGGVQPAGYHAVNLLLHWLNALVAFLLVRGITGRRWAALAAAAVFASHPLTVESVTNVVGRADLLASLSIVGGLCLYRRFLAAYGGRRMLWLAALGLSFLGGVLSKESAAVLPALMALHDALFPPAEGANRRATFRNSAARAWPAYACVAGAALAVAWGRWVLFHDAAFPTPFGGDNPIVNAPVMTGVMTSVKVAGYSLALVAWPARLSCDYSFAAITLFGWTWFSGQDLHAWLALAAILLLFAAAVVSRRRNPAITFFLGFAAITFLPTSNLLIPIGATMAERFMYVPLIGLAAAAALALGAALGGVTATRFAVKPRGRVIAATAVAVVAVSALSARTLARNEDWTSNRTLWASAANVVPESYKVYKALALDAMESDPSGGRVDEAISLASRGMAIIERANLPLAQQPAGLYAEAGSYQLRKAQGLAAHAPGAGQPGFAQAIVLLRRAESIDREMNRLEREKQLAAGRPAEQIHDVGSAFIYKMLATAYLGATDPLSAAGAAESLQRISPDQFDAHYTRGVAEAAAAQFESARGNGEAARAHLSRAAVNLLGATILDPWHREPWPLLAQIYQYLAPAPPAIVLSAEGGSMNPQNPAVVRDAQLACAQLLSLLRAAGLEAEAGAARKRMIDELGIPPAVLDAGTARGR